MNRHFFWLTIILLAGLGLRVKGIQWGRPSDGGFFHGSSYHPDEQALFNGLKQLSWHQKHFYPTDIQMLSRGPLQVYTVGGALGLAYPWLPSSRDREFYKKNPAALRHLYLIGRAVSIVQSLAAIAALFWLGTLQANWRVGAAAAALMAIAPIHVVNAHYISADSAFCLYLVLLAIACEFILKTAHWKSYLAAGVIWGLLTANKYNAASTGLLILMAHLLSDVPHKSYRSLAVAAAAGGLTCMVCNPVVLFGFRDFLHALHHSYYSNLQLRLFMYDAGYPTSAARFYLWDAGRFGLGIPLYVTALGALVYMALHGNRSLWIWVPWAVLFLMALCQSGWRLVRWIMPLTPFIFIEIARWWEDSHLWGRWNPVRHVLALLVLTYTTLYSWTYVQAMAQPDVRDTSSDWIVQHIPRGSRIAMKGRPYFWTPTIFQSPYYHPEEADALRRDWGYDMVYLPATLQDLQAQDPTYVVLGCYDINVYQRDPAAYQAFPQGQFTAELLNPKRYKVLAVFEKQLRVAGREWFGDTFYFPHDWRYPFPKIYVLEKRTRVFS